MEDRKSESRPESRAEMARRLIEAIDRVRVDIARVELWAYAVSGFSEPVAEYDPQKATIWLPTEQAKKLQTLEHGGR